MKMQGIGYYALASMLLLASCQEDFKDEVQPAIEITSPAAGQKIWLDAPLTVDAANEQGLSKVAFYLDDELIGEDTEAPYELMLNTQDYEDGDYTLRAVAYDGAGNRTETEQRVDVFNKLLTIEVEDNAHFLNWHEENRRWIFISDRKGKILQTEELALGSNFIFERPAEFKDSIFSVTEVDLLYRSDSDRNVYISTYDKIKPDRWVMRGYSNGSSVEPTVIGEATGSFVKSYYQYTAHVLNGWFYPIDEDYEVNFEIELHQDPARFYLATYPDQEAPHYVSIDAVRPGDHYELTSQDLVPMDAIETITLPPSFYYADVNVRGKYIAGDGFSRQVSTSTMEPTTNELSVYRPKGIFDDYSYHLNASSDHVSYYRSDYGEMPTSYDFPTVNPVTIISTDRKNFEASLHRAHDYLSVGWGDYDSDQAIQFVNWSIISEGGDKVQLTAPAFPESITNEYPLLGERIQNLSFSDVSLLSNDAISSFDDYMSRIYQREESTSDTKTYESIYVRDQSESSRVAAEAWPETIKQELEQRAQVHLRRGR